MEYSDQEILEMIKEQRESYGKSWRDVADVLNDKLGYAYTESKYRHQYLRNKQRCVDDYISTKIQQTKERDILNQANAYIRDISREQMLRDIAIECAQEMSSKKLLPVYFENDLETIGDNAGILCISDWHYGLEFSNHWNTFDREIAKKRVIALLNKTVEYGKKNGVKNLIVLNLSDLIAGRIHSQIRYQSRVDVITQTIEISEILAEFLTNLSKYFSVYYMDCLDNHSRLEPNKGESMRLESLVRIITFYLKERLKNTDIVISDNTYSEDIISFSVLGHNVCAVHGDLDRPDNVVKNLTLMSKNHWDLILTSHRHHFSADENNETLVVSNGSLMGTDSYAESLRLNSKPSQNLIIVTPENVAECIYRITL